MGTRADFYIGAGKKMEWLGSVAWDGYEYDENEKHPIRTAKNEKEYRARVNKEIEGRDDGTKPEDGWPWPWNDSSTTDYAYTFIGGKFRTLPDGTSFPDMSKIKNVTLGSRSGVMIFKGLK
jgi:hypothetical protein